MSKPTDREIFFYRARFQAGLYHDVIGRFAELAENHGYTVKQLAADTGRTAFEVKRLLENSHLWDLELVSDFLLVMGAQPKVEIVPVSQI